ncbi:T9SS type A sorting domain-containing protein [Flavobacteriaceae bacterium 144Ye]|nr:T9SS type A sorting domain-containing protein [Flavobacteriaceae bacterium 144Ye]
MRAQLIYLTTLCFLFSVNLKTYSQECNDDEHTGDATYYTSFGNGACSFPDDGNMLYCALNPSDYDNANACGAFIEVTGPSGTVTVKVEDLCPECEEGDMDLSETAFSQIGNIADGIIPITWRFVPGDLATSILVHYNDGSNPYFMSIQFLDIEHAVIQAEYQTSGGTWESLPRSEFNSFYAASGGSPFPSPINLRITSILGEVLTLNNVVLDFNEAFNTGTQFTTPPECLNSLTIADDELTSIKVFPNPTVDVLNIDGNFTGQWELWDMHGKKIKTGHSKEIQVQSLTTGLYFLNISVNDGETFNFKIIKN